MQTTQHGDIMKEEKELLQELDDIAKQLKRILRDGNSMGW